MVPSRVIEWARVWWNVVATVPRMEVGVAWVAFRRWCGVHFSRLLSPTSQLLTRAVGEVRCTHCLFFRGTVAIVVVVWGTLLVLLSITS